MDRINVLFKMLVCSLALIFYSTFGIHKTGVISFYELFGYPNYTLDSILSNIIFLISALGSILFFYSSFLLLFESIKFLKKNKE